MKHRAPFSSLSSVVPALVATCALFAVGCETTIGGGGDDGENGNNTGGGAATGTSGASGNAGNAGTSAGNTGTGGNGTGGTSGGVGGTGGTGGTDPNVTCVGTHVTTNKRVVRLTDNQIVNTYTAIFGAMPTATIIANEDIPPAINRAFPPLEGDIPLSPTHWSVRDRMAQGAMAYVGSNLMTQTNCGANPTAACGQMAVATFAAKAYRRPLTAEETASNQALWTELVTTNGSTVADAIKYSYYAVLSAPEFLYRTEYGGDFNTDGPLDQYELASEISYFVLDGPPDAELIAAAAAGQLTDKEAVRGQVTRMLGVPSAHANLEAAMIAYFSLTGVPSIVIDPATAPGITVTGGLLSSMLHEGELFMTNTLWRGVMNDLVLSKQTWVNSQIAMPIYGVATPTQVDANGFGQITMPADRTGLLTLAPFLTSRTRPMGTSVVGRGLAVNQALTCTVNPAFPEGNAVVTDTIAMQSGWTEKQKADFRANPANANGICYGCHAQFDAMGLVLENYDSVGRFRTMDLGGNAIDAAWVTSKLPEAFNRDVNGDGTIDEVTVTGPVSLATELTFARPEVGNSSAIERCMAMNFINFALADESQGSARAPMPEHPTNSCAVRSVTDAFVTGDKSFSSLIREIAASDTLTLRTRGN